MREAVKSLVVKAFCAVEAVVALRSRSRCHLYLLNPFIFLKHFHFMISGQNHLPVIKDSES